MISRALAIIVFWMFAGVANAQTVQIRTGEHNGFTRLVLTMPGPAIWRMDQSKNKATLVFNNKKLTFDTSAVFNRITRDRLTAIASDSSAGKLTLNLGCGCRLRSFWQDDKMLVIDIVDAENQAAKVNPRQRPGEPLKEMAQSRPIQSTLVQPDSLAAALAIAQFETAIMADVAEENTGKSDGAMSSAMLNESSQLAEMRNRLLHQVGRAATQGLLTPEAGYPKRGDNENRDEHHTSEQVQIEKPAAAETERHRANQSSNININAQTSIDRDFMANLGLAGQAFEFSSCLEPDELQVSEWGTTEAFSSQIGALRGRLIEEFDRTNPDVAIELAKLYIYFGFGLEARQAVIMSDESTAMAHILRDMAAIIENGYAPEGSVLLGKLDCQTPVALWSVLAHSILPKHAMIEKKVVLRAFSALPAHLRSQLGPVLSQRFLVAGDAEMAEKILRIINRKKDQFSPDANILQAEMHFSEDDNVAAESTLDNVIKSNSEPSAKAVLRLIESRLETDEEISFEMAQLAGAYAQENRGEPIGHDLLLAYLSALASSGAYDQSYREFDRVVSQLAPEEILAVQNQLLKLLVRNADELTFLQYALSGRGDPVTGLKPDLGNAMAGRLVAVGFFSAARPFVAADASGSAGEQRQLIRAEISLNEGRPRQAMVDLMGLDSVDANLVRARARSDMGEHLEAYQLYDAGGKQAEAERSAWFAEDWDRLSKQDNPVLTDVAALVQPSPETSGAKQDESVPDEDRSQELGVLAENRKLLEDSEDARTALSALLSAKPSPAVVAE